MAKISSACSSGTRTEMIRNPYPGHGAEAASPLPLSPACTTALTNTHAAQSPEVPDVFLKICIVSSSTAYFFIPKSGRSGPGSPSDRGPESRILATGQDLPHPLLRTLAECALHKLEKFVLVAVSQLAGRGGIRALRTSDTTSTRRKRFLVTDSDTSSGPGSGCPPSSPVAVLDIVDVVRRNEHVEFSAPSVPARRG